jgi:hypothetical protein
MWFGLEFVHARVFAFAAFVCGVGVIGITIIAAEIMRAWFPEKKLSGLIGLGAFLLVSATVALVVLLALPRGD